jgi:hypothetical protein
MYCQSCGSEVTKELNYCNRCGANLNLPSTLPDAPVRPVNLTGPTIAIALMVVIGMGIIFASVNDLARKDVNWAGLTWMVIVGLGMIGGVAALIIRQWSHLAGAARQQERPLSRKKPAEKESAPMSLPPANSQPIASVTDHTTRTFDPVYREPLKRGK